MKNSLQKSMKTFFWLVRREFWENKAIFFWLPLALSAVFFVLFLVVEIGFKEVLSADGFHRIQNLFGELYASLLRVRMVTYMPLQMGRFFIHSLLVTGAFVSTFYLLSSLYGDRRDRSILFWKSMPMSDTQQVLVKLVFPLVLTPFVAIVFGFLSYFIAALIVAVLSIFGYYNFFSIMMSNADLYTLPLSYLSLMPIYFVWALPTMGWFLFVSSMAKSRVVPWAIGTPILGMLILKFVNSAFQLNLDLMWINMNLFVRLIASNLPVHWVMQLSPTDVKMLKIQGIDTDIMNVAWSSPNLWLGAVFGVLMISLAIRARKHADALS